jgi:hypothetical protein
MKSFLVHVCLFLTLGFALFAANITPVILDVGPHHKTVQSESGGAYTALADGMHYENNGQWVDSKEEIELFQDGAMARQGQHKAVFAPNANTVGAIELLTPDGKRFRSHIIGLAYFDSASGQSTLIAEVKDSIGQLIAPNRIVYPDAFTDIQADIQFTWRRGSFEQDVVLFQNPPSALEYGLNPDTSRLQVWTEFVEAPVPQQQQFVLRAEQNAAIRQLMAEPDFTDTRLDFGALSIGVGKAFSLANEANQSRSVHVAKEWAVVEGRQFLIESVEVPAIKPLLDTLPAAAALGNPGNANVAALKRQPAKSKADLIAQLRKLPPPSKPGGKQKIEVAAAYRPKRGVVLDYVTHYTASQNNYIFRADTTYYIDGQVTLGGTTTLEGGTVIKFNNANYAQLRITGSGAKINCLTSSYRPAILTAKDDQSLGEQIYYSGSSPSGYYATYGIYFDYASSGVLSTLHDVRISHANTAIYYYSGSGHTLTHSAIMKCGTGIDAYSAEVRVRNALIHSNYTAFASYSSYPTIRAEHITVNQCDYLNYGANTTFYITNSLLVANGSVTYYALYGQNYNIVSAGTPVFQTVGAGSHYLLDNAYRNAGTATIDPALAADLKTKTTYPPIVLAGDFTLPTVLSPQAQRDTDLPDLGYHPDPIDYAWSGLNLSSTLILTNGVAVAIYGPKGTTLLPGAKFISEGDPLRLNRVCRYNAAQENSITWGTSASTMSLFNLTNTGATLPEVRMRFTDISLLADVSSEQYIIESANAYPIGVLAFTDCHLRGGYINLANHGTNAQTATIAFTNNFLQRVNFTMRQAYNGDTTPAPLHFWNNLVVGSILTLQGGTVPQIAAWTARDNFFDAVTISASTFGNSHNAYTTAATLPGTTGNDQVSIVPNYVTSALGTNYYGTSPPLSNLVNAGSRNRDAAALYHYTVLAAQTKEGEDTGSAVVDIGFHFIALSTGLPKDSDSDGIPDFVENRSGTGVFTSGIDPSDWTSYTSPNSLTGNPGLQVFTPLK